MRFLKTVTFALTALFATTSASAAVLTEGFDDPFEGWETRWFGTESNAFNYYVSEQGPSNVNYRGAPDVTGMWLSDGDSYRDGGDYGQINIVFNAAFAASLTEFAMDVATALPDGAALVFFDKAGVQLSSTVVPVSPSSVYFTPTGYNRVSVTSANGIGGFSFTGFAQGNTIVDNLRAVTATSAVPETATWMMLIVGFGAVGATLRRRTPSTSVAFG